MTGESDTVAGYLDALDPGRRAIVDAALGLVRARIPDGYHETFQHGMISWVIPLERYAYTYNGEPLAVVSLASQKRHVALYLHGVHMDPAAGEALARAYADAETRLDMGRSCLRFRSWSEVLPDAVGAAVEAAPPGRFIALYEQGQGPERMAKHRAAAERRAAKETKTT